MCSIGGKRTSITVDSLRDQSSGARVEGPLEVRGEQSYETITPSFHIPQQSQRSVERQ